jgi:NADPH-dependent ferric siderophore reductase
MQPAGSPKRAPAKAPGRLSQALLRLLMRRASIVATDRLADRFRLITLEGPALQGVAWTPGQKIQIAMGSAFVARTFTPIEWNATIGRTRILGCAHGGGPGSDWVLGVEPGDECDMFGPRASLDLRRATGAIAMFGDETSIALAYALVHQDPARSVSCFFEVDDVEIYRDVLNQLEIGRASLFSKRNDDAPEAMDANIPALAAAGTCFVLTGKAATVQRLRQGLKRHGVPSSNILAKAYWAPGKTGLD